MHWALSVIAIILAVGIITMAVQVRRLERQVRGLRHKNREAFEELCLEHDKLIAARAALPALEEAHASLTAERQSWERRFWEMHAVVERVLCERDSWKQMFRVQAAEHLEGQAVLEQRIVEHRQHLYRALATLHRVQCDSAKHPTGEAMAKIVRGLRDLDPLDGPPVGQAARYYERMKALLMKEAPEAFDALAARATISQDLRGPAMGAPTEQEPHDTHRVQA